MAVVSLTINNADVPDVLAAFTANYRDLAIHRSFADDAMAYNNATTAQQGKALLAAAVFQITRDYRTTIARQTVTGADPDIT